MTSKSLPDKLAKRRDELCVEFINESEMYSQEWETNDGCSYSAGFNSCYKELEPLIDTLKLIRDNNIVDWCPECSVGEKAEEALKNVGI